MISICSPGNGAITEWRARKKEALRSQKECEKPFIFPDQVSKLISLFSHCLNVIPSIFLILKHIRICKSSNGQWSLGNRDGNLFAILNCHIRLPAYKEYSHIFAIQQYHCIYWTSICQNKIFRSVTPCNPASLHQLQVSITK